MGVVQRLRTSERSEQEARRESRGLRQLAELAASYSFREIEKAAEAGKSVIWGGCSWDSPLIYACDTIPAAVDQLWAQESRESEAVAEEVFQIPSEFCSMIKAMLGRLHIDRNKNIKRILYFGSGCEPMSSILELSKVDGYEIQTIDTVSAFKSADKRDHAIAFLVAELRRIALWLTGKPVDEDRVGREIRRKNASLRKVARVLELRSRHPLYVDGDATGAIFAGSMHNFGNPEKFAAMLDQLIAELEQLDALGYPQPPYIPLVIAGSVGNPKIFEAIEESNGAIVGWIYYGTQPYREDVPPLEALAHFVLDAQGSGELGEEVGSSVAYRRNAVAKEVARTGARGVISASITGCPYASLMQQLERDHFKKLDVPIVTLETDVHKEPPTEEQIMRIKAFVEMLA